MAVEFKLDNLGDDVESGDVLEIMVAVGDTIELEQGVIELETDKATMVVPSEFAGTVTKICCCLLYTSPSPRDKRQSRMPSSA